MKRSMIAATAAALVAALAVGTGSINWERVQQYRGQADRAKWQPALVLQAVAGWPETSRLAANRMLDKYGPPASVTDKRLIWTGQGPWQWMIVYREEDFASRSGVVVQCVRYETAGSDLAALNKLGVGVAAYPEDALLVASAESEEMNVLALNVAVEMLRGARTVAESRELYRKTQDLALSGKESRYTKGLIFAPMSKEKKARPAWLQPLMP